MKTWGKLSRVSLFRIMDRLSRLRASGFFLAWTLAAATLAVPCAVAGTVNLTPGNDIPAIVNSSPAGTIFQFAPGLYRLSTPVVPLAGDTFLGASGQTTVLSGAIVINSFIRQGGYWTATLQLDHVNPVCDAGPCTCNPDFPACDLSEDLFIDNKILKRVTQLSAVASGKWFWDLNSGLIYLADDPSGHLVEVSAAPQAFAGDAANVTIVGLVIEKFAGEGILEQSGTAQYGVNWIVENSNIRYGHLAGIANGNRTQVLNNILCDNGKLGIAEGGGQNNLIQGNEICRNNYAGFFEDSGGAKFNNAIKLVVRNNFVHDNFGPGLHTDGGSVDILYENNHTTGNQGPGIDHEISHAATIRNNLIENDAFVSSGTSVPHGTGILVFASDNVEVYGNSVTNSMNGIAGYQFLRVDSLGTHILSNLSVHNNFITQQAGAAAGVLVYSKDPSFYPMVFTTWNNRFDNNTYCLSTPTGNHFDWQLTTISFADWQQVYGQDVHSVLSCSTTPPSEADFSISVGSGTSSSATIRAGQSATYALSLVGVNGFSGAVSLACSGAPLDSVCSFSSNSVTLSGTAAQTAMVIVSTTARSALVEYLRRIIQQGLVRQMVLVGLLIFFGLAMLANARHQQAGSGRRSSPALAGLLLVVSLLSSCALAVNTSPASPPPPPQTGTPAGTSTLVITASSGNSTHSTDLVLTVN
jgi:hypothetical protein